MAIGAFSVKRRSEFSPTETPIHGLLVVSRFELERQGFLFKTF